MLREKRNSKKGIRIESVGSWETLMHTSHCNMSLQVIFIISERSWRLGEVTNDWRKTTVNPPSKKGKEDNL